MKAHFNSFYIQHEKPLTYKYVNFEQIAKDHSLITGEISIENILNLEKIIKKFIQENK